MSINNTKRILSFLVSSILASGNVMAMNSPKKNSQSKSVPKPQIVKPLLIGAGIVVPSGAAITTGVVLYKKNTTKETNSSSPTYVSSRSISYSPSNNYFINYQPTSSSTSNKLDKNVENKCLYKIKLFDNVFFSVYEGCITTVRTGKDGDKTAVMTPDNENLDPKGYLAQAIAIDFFGKDEYPDRQNLLNICSNWPGNAGKENKFVLPTGSAILGKGANGNEIIHVVGPCKNSNEKATDEYLGLLTNAYLNGIIGAVASNNDKVPSCQNVNLCLISDGSFGFTTAESVECLCTALGYLKGKLGNFDYEINLNLVIHPKYNKPNEGGPDTKTQIAIKQLKNKFPGKQDLVGINGENLKLELVENGIEIINK